MLLTLTQIHLNFKFKSLITKILLGMLKCKKQMRHRNRIWDFWMELNYGMESGLVLELVGKGGQEGHELI